MISKSYNHKELNTAPIGYHKTPKEITTLIAISKLLQVKQMLAKQIKAPLSLEKNNNYTTYSFDSTKNKALLSKIIEEIDSQINQKLSEFPEMYRLQVLDFIAGFNFASDSGNEQELSGDFSKAELED